MNDKSFVPQHNFWLRLDSQNSDFWLVDASILFWNALLCRSNRSISANIIKEDHNNSGKFERIGPNRKVKH